MSSETKAAALEKAAQLLELLRSHDFSGPFLEPFDPELLGLVKYDEVVERRMDLGTVKAKLEAVLAATSGTAAHAAATAAASAAPKSKKKR